MWYIATYFFYSEKKENYNLTIVFGSFIIHIETCGYIFFFTYKIRFLKINSNFQWKAESLSQDINIPQLF